MKCPICNNEMLTGKIESNREIMWMENGEKNKERISSKLFISSKAEAERCEACGILLVKECER